MLDRLRGQCLEIHGAKNSAKDPVIRGALSGVRPGIGGLLGDIDFEKILRAEFDERRDVVAEAVERALMRGAGGEAVDLDRGVGHDALEDDPDTAAFPAFWDGESQPIEAVLVRVWNAF